jgi:hypothetical protein
MLNYSSEQPGKTGKTKVYQVDAPQKLAMPRRQRRVQLLKPHLCNASWRQQLFTSSSTAAAHSSMQVRDSTT